MGPVLHRVVSLLAILSEAEKGNDDSQAGRNLLHLFTPPIFDT